MPIFDDPVQVRGDNGEVRGYVGSGLFTLFREAFDGGNPWGGLADGFHCLSDRMWLSNGGKPRVFLEGDTANLWLGGAGQGGDVVLFSGDAPDAMAGTVHQSTILLAGDPGVIVLRRRGGQETIVIDGPQGDIILRNADCAEDFEVEPDAEVEPGSVLVVAETGRLRLADQPYDRRVAGVVSGAGGLKPGVVLGRQPDRDGAVPIGLAGRVFCKVDAGERPVETGDLLTTSGTVGHAMVADRPDRAFGAVLGKALAPLAAGRGLVPILVSLQ